MKYIQILNKHMKEEGYSQGMILKGKVISLIESLKFNKGVVITGPRCSGKTAIPKILGYLMKNSDLNIDMRISILNPDVYNVEKLYGTAESGVMNPEISTNDDVRISSISSNVLEIALKGFDALTRQAEQNQRHDDLEFEKPVDVSSVDSQSEEAPDKPKLLKTLLFESSSLSPLWSDCLIDFIKESNYATNMFSPLIENDFTKGKMCKDIPITFPNGSSTKISQDILMMFECDSLREASPSFISNTVLVHTEENTVKWKELFSREKSKLIKQLKKKPFEDFALQSHFDNAFKGFVVPFIDKL